MRQNANLRKTGKPLLVLLLILSASTLCALFLNPLGIGTETIILLYLLAVLFCTVLTRSYLYGIFSAISSVMVFNYFFTEPLHTFHIYSTSDIILLIFFFITALVAGTLMSRLQQQTDLSLRNEKTARLLSRISGEFIGITGKDNIPVYGISYIKKHSGLDARILLSDGSAYGADLPEVSPDAPRYVINGAGGPLGEIRIILDGRELTGETDLLIKTVAAQIGVTLDREYIYHEREELRVAMEGEKLRSILLRAVAHDLRTPLTSLSGAGETLYDHFDRLTPQEQKSLAKDISEEMIWLTQLVENILNMTRINEGQLILNRSYEVVDDVVGETVSHMKRLLAGRDFQVSLPSEVVELYIDGKLIVQVLTNLLVNAVRHTPAEAKIRLDVSADGCGAVFTVSDTGGGIDPERKKALFRSFIRPQKGIADGQRGMGLGLSICKAVVEAHGGTIRVEDNTPSGTRMIVTLPAGGLS